MKRLSAVLVAALGFTLLAMLTGCGGGGDSSPAPTKTAYLEEVNEICSEGQDKHDQLINASLKKFEQRGEDPKLQEELVLELQEPYEETTERLADLTPPANGGQAVEALIAAREKAAETVTEDPLLVYKGHPYRQVEKLAKSSGAGECLI